MPSTRTGRMDRLADDADLVMIDASPAGRRTLAMLLVAVLLGATAWACIILGLRAAFA